MRGVAERPGAGRGRRRRGFTAADEAALSGEWAWFLDVVRPAVAAGPAGLIDDDLAYVGPWGFDVAGIAVPVLLLHGEDDTVVPVSHARWNARRIPGAELWVRPDAGHISVLDGGAAALAWLAEVDERTPDRRKRGPAAP
ncbi:alpha/beta fold hydrolase [Georgenia yuyongxinii]|uniref:alpha/beta fold hydrolase n=1 Tax=Georgenia yuyongxinii TaxID=2589797 RepID=UPI00364016E2